MKKKNYLALLLLFCATFILVGCGSTKEEKKEDKNSTSEKSKSQENVVKTLSCTILEENVEDIMNVKMTMDFDYDEGKKEIVNGNLKAIMTVTKSDITDSEMKEFKETDFCKDGTLSDFDEYARDCKTEVNGNTNTAIVDFDIDKISAEEDGAIKKNMTLEEVQSSFIKEFGEQSTCTIK